MKKAQFYKKIEGTNKIICTLCPHQCSIIDGSQGICRTRLNIKGELFSNNYEKLCSISYDPIEKKPLYHFYPGKKILSIGSIGCNLKCKFCQNYEISQTSVEEYGDISSYTSEEVVLSALNKKDNIGIAYTYNEPTVWFEYMLETARLAKQEGLKNVMVSNGFINPKPLEKLIPYMDAFSIDLKGFTNEFYNNFTSSMIEAVLATIQQIYKSGKHLEITNLVITDLNDDENEFQKMVDWIIHECSQSTVLHISRYFPMFKIKNLPTSQSKLEDLYEIASKKLDYVYLGNIETEWSSNTFCSSCKNLLIDRNRYTTNIIGLDEKGQCKKCKSQQINYLSGI